MTLSPILPWLIVAALVAQIASCGRINSLQSKVDTAATAARQAKQDIDARDTVIQQLKDDARDKEHQRAQLEKARSAVDATLANTQQQLQRLIHENESIRAWADTPLPDDVVRLHASPALASADDYSRAVPASEALRDAGATPAQER